MPRKPFLPNFTVQYRRLAITGLCILLFGGILQVVLITSTDISRGYIYTLMTAVHGSVAYVGVKLVHRGLLQRHSELDDVRNLSAVDHIGFGLTLILIAAMSLYILVTKILLPAP